MQRRSKLHFLDILLDALFPKFCYLCFTPSQYLLCNHCSSKIKEKKRGTFIFPQNSDILRVFIAFEYEEEVPLLVEELKYKGRKEVVPFLVSMLDFVEKDYDYIIPTPLHHVRLRERGFNQSDLIARELSKKLGIPVLKTGIIRKRYTEHQVSLTKSEREENLRNAFYVRKAERFKDKRILLVDDVYTTGSTLNNLAKAFKGYPAKIDGFVLASKV